MKFNFLTTPTFDRLIKKIAKKHPSIKKDLLSLIDELKISTEKGIDLGNGFRKIRLSISSTNKGARGGVRVITHQEIMIKEDRGEILFVAIYLKSETSTISIEDLKRIAQNFK